MKRLAFILIGLVICTIALLLLFDNSPSCYNHVDLETSNTINNTTSMNFLDTVVHVSATLLDVDSTIIVIADIKDAPKSIVPDYLSSAKAFVCHDDYNVYFIYVTKQTHETALKVMLHEMSHVQQHVSNRLEQVSDSIRFDNQVFSIDELPEYEFMPW